MSMRRFETPYGTILLNPCHVTWVSWRRPGDDPEVVCVGIIGGRQTILRFKSEADAAAAVDEMASWGQR